MLQAEITEAENHLRNLGNVLDRISDTKYNDRMPISPEDKLLLHQIKKALETKQTQMQERADNVRNQIGQMEDDVCSLDEFAEQIEYAVNSLDEIL